MVLSFSPSVSLNKVSYSILSAGVISAIALAHECVFLLMSDDPEVDNIVSLGVWRLLAIFWATSTRDTHPGAEQHWDRDDDVPCK